MKTVWKRALAMLLAVIIISGFAPIGALAEMDWPTLPDGVVSSWVNDGIGTVKSATAWLGEQLSGLSFRASAVTISGSCGPMVTWHLDTESGEMTISGTGAMYYSSWNPSESSYIKTVTIGSGVTSICRNAFFDCTRLTSVTIPDSVTSIDNFAFHGCTGLTGITIPDSVTSIGASAFYACTSLTSITIPDSVTRIGENAFYNCYCLARVDYTGTLAQWCEISFENSCANPVLYAKKLYIQDVLLAGDITIPDGVTSVGSYAFYSCTDLTSITIPDGVTSIGEYAFYGCTGLTGITIPDSVTSIGENAFYNCSSLTRVDYTGTLAQWCEISFENSCANPVLYAKKLYIQDVLLAGDITIPDGVTSVGSYAFHSCTDLTSITIPDGVTSIGEDAFYGCTALESMTLPFVGLSPDATNANSVFGAIFGSSTYATVYDRVQQYYTSSSSSYYYIPSSLRKVTLTSCTSIPYGAFYNCSMLTEIKLPDSVTSIGENAFYNCSSLTRVDYTGTLAQWCEISFKSCANPVLYAEKLYIQDVLLDGDVTIPDSVTSICDRAFYFCTGLTSVTVGSGVTSIGDSAFRGCTGLTRVTIPNSVTSICDRAFSDCTGLTSVTVGSGVTSIGKAAFAHCTRLKSVTIPDSVTSIGDSAFSDCTSLASITIPDSVTSIGEYAFFNSVLNINYSGSASGSPWGAECINKYAEGIFAFDSNQKTTLLRCRRHVTGAVTIPDSVTRISEDAFRERTGLTSVTVPDSVTSIGSNAFSGCTKLQSITLPFIGTAKNATGANYAFGAIFGYSKTNTTGSIPHYDNGYYYNIPASLRSVTITGGTIPDHAFYKCSMLTSVTFTDGVQSVGSCVLDDTSFYQNQANWRNGVFFCGAHLIRADESLMKYIIPAGIKTVADDAFVGCALSQITIPECVVRIGNRAFMNCKALTACLLPDSVTEIGDSAFQNCTNLASIHIPGSVTKIGQSALLGTPAYICSNLNTSYAASYAQSNGIEFRTCGHQTTHDYSSRVVTAPTCTEQGYTTVTCTVCGDSYKIDYTPALGHDYSAQTVPATCTQDGSAVYTCSRCSDSYSEVLPSHGHNYTVQSVSATCTTGGSATYTCSRCGDSYTETVAALGHDFGAWITVTAPTIEAEGLQQRTCTRCGEKETQSVPKIEVKTVTNAATNVSVSYPETAFDSEVELKVEQVSDGSAFQLVDSNSEKSAVFDISTMQNGVSVQPSEKVTVRIPIPTGFDPAKCVVYYVSAAANKLEKLPTRIEGSYIVFQTDHFSIYAVAIEKSAPPKVVIQNFTASSKAYDYRSSITFKATVENPLSGGQIHWFVDGKDVGTGESYTAENVKQSFSLQAKYYVDGKEIPEAATETEKVNVNTGFFAKLKAFFRSLFGLLPKVTQEYLGIEIIDRILPD